MKLSGLSVAAAAFLAIMSSLASCSSDMNPVDHLRNINGDKAYVQLDLNVAATRADDGASTTSAETAISSVYLYIFDNDGYLESGPLAPAITDGKVTLETTPGIKTIYAIANKDVFAAAGSSSAQLTADEFESAIIDASLSSLKLTKSFVLVGKTVTSSLTGSKTPVNIPASNRLQINLERLLARAHVVSSSFSNAAIGISAFNPSQFNVLQTAGKMKLLSDGDEISDDYVDSDSNGTYDGYSYSLDEGSNVDITSSFDLKNCLYIPENIVASPVAGNTTFLVLSYSVIPEKYYSYNNGSLQTNTASYGLGSMTAIGIYDSDGNFMDFYKDSDGKILFFASESAVNAYKNEYSSDFPSITTYKNLVYSNGIAYYRVNISDVGNDKTNYRVLRNKSYTITVNSISNLGMPSAADLIPSNPASSLEESENQQKTWLNATFSVAGWSVENQGIDL